MIVPKSKRPKTIVVLMVILGLGLSFTNTMVNFVFTMNNPENMKQAFILSREARGLPVRPENVERIFSTTGISMVFGLSTAIIFLLAALIIWKRDYFLNSERQV